MPRAGSELLQVLLHQNPRIYASPTSPLLEYLFGARGNRECPEVLAQPGELMTSAFHGGCRGFAQGYYSAITDRPIVCDKSRGWLQYTEWTEAWNGEAKTLCIVRDLRDILASMERLYRANRDIPGPDDPANMVGLTVESRVNVWLKTHPVGVALQRIQGIFERKIESVRFIRYEDLTTRPDTVFSEIYSWLDEPYFQHNYTDISKEVIENASVFGPYAEHTVASKLSPGTSTRNLYLPKHVCAYVVKAYPAYFKSFGYS
jgi:sulfotransferase